MNINNIVISIVLNYSCMYKQLSDNIMNNM